MIMIQAFISTHPQISWYQLQPVYLAKCICPQTIFSTLQQVPPHKYFYHPPPSPRPPSPAPPSLAQAEIENYKQEREIAFRYRI